MQRVGRRGILSWGPPHSWVRWSHSTLIGSPSKKSPLEVSKDPSDYGTMRNIGISAHIDSGKTTLSERLLFYAGKIQAIHEVKGKDKVGASMDHHELERERGITIKSAATFIEWGGFQLNVIDTPGHVDFTVEVERSLKVMDACVLLLCAVGGIQNQTRTIDRQIRRYNLPRLCFINKMDRAGARPFVVADGIRDQLQLPAELLQIPIGFGDTFEGIIDLIDMKALYFEGSHGQEVVAKPIPENMLEQAAEYRGKLLDTLMEVDGNLAELYLNDDPMNGPTLRPAIRKLVLSHKFVPILLGSAYKNKGAQPLMDAVVDFLPDPSQRINYALKQKKTKGGDPEKLAIDPDPKGNFLGLVFKVQESPFGQLSWIRVYSGTLKKGYAAINVRTGDKQRMARLMRMHAEEVTAVDVLPCGDVGGVYGIECQSGDTFVGSQQGIVMSSLHVPEPVVSIGITLKEGKGAQFEHLLKVLAKFQREDPTFKVNTDAESGQIQINGMGELHLEIYLERMRREEGLHVIVGKPFVSYREVITEKIPFSYLHRRQTGGRGQYARIIGTIEPISFKAQEKFQFVSRIENQVLPDKYIYAAKKGFQECMAKGLLIGHEIWGIKIVLTDGQLHAVDSSDVAFFIAAQDCFAQFFPKASPTLVEPMMKVEIEAPRDALRAISKSLIERHGEVHEEETNDYGCVIRGVVPLGEMFGYSTEVRQLTSGEGSVQMEFDSYSLVEQSRLPDILEEYKDAAWGAGQVDEKKSKKKK